MRKERMKEREKERKKVESWKLNRRGIFDTGKPFGHFPFCIVWNI